MQSDALIPIGSEINIYKSKIRTDIPQTLLTKLPMEISAKIIDYKITDGTGIGYVLMTDNKLKIWIFCNELNQETKERYGIEDPFYNDNMILNGKIINQYVGELELNGDYKISYLLNPVNLIKWSLYTLKDIF